MDVVYCSDAKYERIMLVSIVSLLENNKDFDELKVYCISIGISEEAKQELNRLIYEYGRELSIIEGAEYCEKYRVWPKDRDGYYIRLLIPQMIDVDKILYLDCDTVITGSLKELWDTDISDYWLGAVQEVSEKKLKEEAGLSHSDIYFNSGVMLINSKYWKKADLLNKFHRFIKTMPKYGLTNDQRVLNGVCVGHVCIVSLRYNLTSVYVSWPITKLLKIDKADLCYKADDVLDAKNKPIIIHYNGSRPWKPYCDHPKKHVFEEYSNLIPIFTKSENIQIPFVRDLAKKVLPALVYYKIHYLYKSIKLYK